MNSDQQSGSSDTFVRNVVLMAVAVVYVALSLYFITNLYGRVNALEQKLSTAQALLNDKIAATNADMKSSSAALAGQVGMTQKELEARAARLLRQQKAAESRLSAEQAKTAQQVGSVSSEVAGVKTDVGGVKSDVASTRSDLEATKAKLEHAIGDLGLQSGLIAHTRDELEVLKHRGDRNYFEFALLKGKRTPISTISLELKKADPKKSKFTLAVSADDKIIEKKDRTANEPLQFYSGREHQLYEIVVYTVEKNKVTGYLSTPKQQAQAAVQQ